MSRTHRNKFVIVGLGLLGAAVLGLQPTPAMAQYTTSTTTFQVTATVQGVCTISATNMDFGSFALAAGASAQSSVTLPAPATSRLVLIQGARSAVAPMSTYRSMTGPNNNYLMYNFTRTPHKTPWGNTWPNTTYSCHHHRRPSDVSCLWHVAGGQMFRLANIPIPSRRLSTGKRDCGPLQEPCTRRGALSRR